MPVIVAPGAPAPPAGVLRTAAFYPDGRCYAAPSSSFTFLAMAPAEISS
jgi:hypothetical protein